MFVDLELVVFLAYYWTGLGIVDYHRGSSPIDRPAYVRGPFYGKILAGAAWPYMCWVNGEFRWFACDFLSSLVVIALSLVVLTIYLSNFWAILIIGLVRMFPIPIISKVYLWAVTAAFAVVLLIASKLFHLEIQMPGAVERYNLYQNQLRSTRS